MNGDIFRPTASIFLSIYHHICPFQYRFGIQQSSSILSYFICETQHSSVTTPQTPEVPFLSVNVSSATHTHTHTAASPTFKHRDLQCSAGFSLASTTQY